MSNINNEVNRLTEIFNALSNPNRLKIFMRLRTCCAPGTMCNFEDDADTCIGDLAKDLDIAPSTLSHHVKELYRAGLIKTQRRGHNVMCWIDEETLKDIAVFFNDDNVKNTSGECASNPE